MYEKEIEFLLDYDWSEVQKVPSQIRSIDETTKAILEELKKDSPLVTEEPTEFEMRILQVLEEPQTLQATNTETLTEEPPVEEPSAEEPLPEEPTVEEPLPEEPPVEEEPVETPIDYSKLIYEELAKQNDQSVIISEQLAEIQAQNEITNSADHLWSTYGLIIIPGLIIVYVLNKMIRPFTSYSSY